MAFKILWIMPPKIYFNSGVYQYNQMLISSVMKDESIAILHLPSGWYRYLYQFLILPFVVFLKSKSYTHIVMYDESISFLNIFCRGASILFVHDVRVTKAKTKREIIKKLYMYLNYKCINWSTKIVAVSDFTKQCLSDSFNIKNVAVLHNIVNVDVVTNEKINDRILSIFNKHVGKCFVLNVGSHESRKNIPLLINIVAELGDDFVLIQAGRPIDSCNFNYNIQLATKNNIQCYFLGEITANDLNFLYRKCDFLLNVSSFEGFGRTPVEAQLNGLIVFSSDCGGLAEALSSGFFRVNLDDDALQIKNNIIECYSNKDEIGILRQQGFINAKKFTPEIVGEKFYQLLDSCVPSKTI